MSVLVRYMVNVSDVDRCIQTAAKFSPMMEEIGGKRGAVYEDENDPALCPRSRSGIATTRCTRLWRSTAQFNEEAGSVGPEWTTHIGHRKGDA